MIEARCFGKSEIVAPAGQILPTSELVFAVALYLCVRAGEHVPRADLVEMFWPQSDEIKGRHSLRQMLYRLKEVGFTLDEDGELLYLNPLRVRCDLADALRSDWIIEAEESTIAAACDALPGLTRRFSERYGEWIDEVRARLESQFRRAALRVLAEAKAEGRWYDVEHWALMLLRSDPLNETAILARAEGTAMLGSKAEAIAQLDRYLDELGPNAERIGLPAKLLRRRIKEQEERKEGEQVLPLVGREDVVRRLTEALYGRETPTPQGFFIFGPAGIGKSRIIAECASVCELSGMTHVAIRLTERDIENPTSISLALSRRLLELRGSLGADPRSLALLKRTLSPSTQGADDTLTGTAVISHQDITWALEQLITAILDESKLLISIDNAQHASLEEIGTLSKVMVKQNPSRLVWYLAGREYPGRLTSSEITPTLSLITPILVRPLSNEDSTTLTRSILASLAKAESTELIAETVSLAGGNPLFIGELVRAASDGRLGKQLPRTLQKTISDRIAALPPAHLEICRIVSLLDAEATLQNIRALCSSSALSLTEGLASLEAEGVLKAGRSGIVELHDCWRLAIDEEMSPLARAIIATSAADYISGKENSLGSPETLIAAARLYAAGNDSKRAFDKYLTAGKTLYERGLCKQAQPILSRAEHHASSPEEHLRVLTVIACTEHALADFSEAISSAKRGLSQKFVPDSASQSNQTTLTAVLADASWKAGQSYWDAMSRLEHLVSLPLVSPSAREHACFLGLRLAYNSQAGRAAEHFLYWASKNSSRAGPTPFAYLTKLVHLAERGSTSEIVLACNELRAIDTSSLPLQYALLTQRYISQSLRWAGEYSSAVSVATAAYDEAARLGILDEAAMIALQVAFTELDISEVEKAQFWIERAELNSPPPRSHERSLALRHVRCRLLLQQSKWEEVWNILLPDISSILADQTLRRRVAETGCLVLAAAHCGQEKVVNEGFESCKETLFGDAPSLQNDFPITAFFRALCAIDRKIDADNLLSDYCNRRSVAYRRPVARHFSEIASLLEHSIAS